MSSRLQAAAVILILCGPLVEMPPVLAQTGEQGAPVSAWRPPFGVERVGAGNPTSAIEAAVSVKAAPMIHPVDVGLIFVPEGCVALSERQQPVLSIAAVSHERDLPDAQVQAWYESKPESRQQTPLQLQQGRRVELDWILSPPELTQDKDTLHVVLASSAGEVLWEASVSVMLVKQLPKLPAFGAQEIELRYDLPILVNEADDGQVNLDRLVRRDYDQGWDDQFQDVVICLPNGSRFVFWRGACYIPFWAGPHNTGLCYEWAETRPPPGAFVDSIEPLMDKELRFSRVEILESTSARVHVRWTYQSVSFKYETFGDQAIEDYVFYPDGFGTRTLRLKKRSGAPYELSEFIVLAAAGMYPFSYLPEQAAEMIYLDNAERHDFHFPPRGHQKGDPAAGEFIPPREGAVVYRIRAHKDDAASAIYFHPSPNHFPKLQFAPFYEGDVQVTPGYWGSHWPLARGKMTGGRIDPLIALTPSHTSLLTWAFDNEPAPENRGTVETLDARGTPAEMSVGTYSWLIGMTDMPDDKLVELARSHADPPAVSIVGGELAWQAWDRTRRVIRLDATSPQVEINLRPSVKTVNPIFEFTSTVGRLISVARDGRRLPEDHYAWDGRTFWLRAEITEPTSLLLEFE